MTKSFGVIDYVVLISMLVFPLSIGVYYGKKGAKMKSAEEYLLARRRLNVVPASVSLVVSVYSAVLLLGMPSEIYTFGAQFYISAAAKVLACVITATFFVPMFRRMNFTSVNEYLQRRFSPGVRTLGSLIFMVHTILYIPIPLYASALALEAVAGIPMYASIIVAGAVCTFYTTLGGMRAVVWTDVFQALVMVAALITIAILGTNEAGGITQVWRVNKEFNRLTFFDFNPDPRVRHTFWSLIIGITVMFLPTWAFNQASVQRMLAVPSLGAAKGVVMLNAPFAVLFFTLACLDGLILFAVYFKCDLRTIGRIRSNDQIVPYFVIDKLGHLQGLPGLFTAAIFAASLSSASSALNAISLIVLEDFVKKCKPSISDSAASKCCKVIAFVFGVVITSLAFVVKFAGSLILQLTITVGGVIMSQLTGCFILGMFFPRANHKGVYTGCVAGFAMATWIVTGARMYPPNMHPGPISVRGCSIFNSTTSSTFNWTGTIVPGRGKPNTGSALAELYHLSYLWLSSIGVSVCLIVGYITSVITETAEDKHRVRQRDPVLLFPTKEWLLSFLPGRTFTWEDGPARGDNGEQDKNDHRTRNIELQDIDDPLIYNKAQ